MTISIALVFNVFTCIIHPFVVYFENPAYASKARQINTVIEAIKDEESDTTVFIDQHIGLPLYANSPRAKMIMSIDAESYFIMTKPEPGDIAYFTSQKDAAAFSQEVFTTYGYSTTDVTTLENPIKGKLTLQSFYNKRTDSLGLYRLTLRESD